MFESTSGGSKCTGKFASKLASAIGPLFGLRARRGEVAGLVAAGEAIGDPSDSLTSLVVLCVLF